MVRQNVEFLFVVGEEVDDYRVTVGFHSGSEDPRHRGNARSCGELLGVDTEMSPPNGHDLIAEECDQTLAVGVSLLAQEEIGLVDAVDRPVVRNIGSNDAAQRREEIVFR